MESKAFMQAVLFDLDGTLVDTAPDFVLAANKLRQQLGKAPLPAAIIAAQVTNGAIAVAKLAFDADEHHADFENYRQALLDSYQQHLGAASAPYDGLLNLLQTLEERGIAWGVVTNKPVFFAHSLMETLGIRERCATLICPDHVKQPKPAPEGLVLAAKELGIEASRCIYVGDHLRDIEAGNAASMSTIAVSYGYLAPDDDANLWLADYVVQTPGELCERILHLIK